MTTWAFTFSTLLFATLIACGSSPESNATTPDGGGSTVLDDATISEDARTTAPDALAGDVETPDDGATLDGGMVDAQDADASSASDGATSTADGGSEDAATLDAAAADAGPPLRTLREVKLFGEVPVDNLVLNSQFDLLAQNWLAIGNISSQPRYIAPRYRVFGQSPAGQPTVLLDGSVESALMGSVMASAPPLRVSVWVGRNLTDAATFEDIRPALIMTLASTGEERVYELTLDAANEAVSLEGIHWRKFTGSVRDASIGTLTFLIYGGAGSPWYVQAPVVRQDSSLRAISSALKPRKLSPIEANLSQEMAKWRRKRLGEAAHRGRSSPRRPPMLRAKP
ncbi:MAG: hypothetical protein IPK13_16485 [Deltaproteobacteria bacterium]|nr:hypothetical protein [Deltaproteobacteria bacterium]